MDLVNNLRMSRVLIIAPHMDDEVIGCSGTILTIRDQISKLIVVHMAEDENRIKEFEKVSAILRIDEHYNLGCEDGFVDLSYKESVLKLISIIQNNQIDTVFIPSSTDDHLDHISTHKIAMDAIGKSRYWPIDHKTCHVQNILEYEVWSFQEKVSVCQDITNYLEKKKEMMALYSSQLEFDYLKYIEYINGYRGLLFNRTGYAECFGLTMI